MPKIKQTLDDQLLSYQIVVLNDGSTDHTLKLVEGYSQVYPITVLSHYINRGLGETERDGFEHICRECVPDDVIIRLDTDDTHDPKFILDILAKLNQGYDVVNTSRFQPGGGQIGVSRYRQLISYAANLFMKVLFNIPGTRDYSCGFRGYRGRILQDAISIFGNYFIQLRGLGFTSTLEMMVKLNLLGARFAEVPFVLRYDQKESESKMVGSITALGYFVMALIYHWPFGGWRRNYQGLGDLYTLDREEAIRKYKKLAIPPASQISF